MKLQKWKLCRYYCRVVLLMILLQCCSPESTTVDSPLGFTLFRSPFRFEVRPGLFSWPVVTTGALTMILTTPLIIVSASPVIRSTSDAGSVAPVLRPLSFSISRATPQLWWWWGGWRCCHRVQHLLVQTLLVLRVLPLLHLLLGEAGLLVPCRQSCFKIIFHSSWSLLTHLMQVHAVTLGTPLVLHEVAAVLGGAKWSFQSSSVNENVVHCLNCSQCILWPQICNIRTRARTLNIIKHELSILLKLDVLLLIQSSDFSICLFHISSSLQNQQMALSIYWPVLVSPHTVCYDWSPPCESCQIFQSSQAS